MLVALSAIAAWPFIGVSSELLNLGVTVLIFAALAYSLEAVYATVGLLALSQGAVWGVGAYVGALTIIHYHFPFLLALLAGGIGGAIAGFLVGLPSLRTKGHYYLILTFAAAEAARISGDNWWGLLKGSFGITLVEPAVILGTPLGTTTQLYFLALGGLLVVIVGLTLLQRLRMGRLMLAVRENEKLAESLGIRTGWSKLSAFALAGFLAGIVGVIYLHYVLHIEPDLFGGWAGVQIALILLIGGSRSRLGPIAGAVVVFMVPPLLHLDPLVTQMTYGVALIALILFVPRGIAGGVAAAMQVVAQTVVLRFRSLSADRT